MGKASVWGREHDESIAKAKQFGTIENGWLVGKYWNDWGAFAKGEIYPAVAKELFNTNSPTKDQIATAGRFYNNLNNSPNARNLLRGFQDNDGNTLERYVPLRNALEGKFRTPQTVLNMEAALKADPTLDDRISALAKSNPKQAESLIRSWDGSTKNLREIVDRASPKPGAVQAVADKPKPPTARPRATRDDDDAPARARAPVATAIRETAPVSERSATEEQAPVSAPSVDERRVAVTGLFTSDEAKAGFSKYLPADIVEGLTETIKNNPTSQDHLAVALREKGELFDSIKNGEQLSAAQKLEATSLMMPVLFAQGIEGKAGSEGVLRSELRGALTGMNLDPNLANTFSDGVLSSPKAQENLARLATENPELLQRLTSKDANRSTAEIAEVKRLMENPKLLEDDKYIAEMRQKAGMGQMFGDLSKWMQDTLGIDVSKMFGDIGSGLGGMFNQIMSWVSGLFGNMGDGNFMRQMAGPNGSQGLGGMMERFSSANQYAMERSGLSARVSGAQALDANGDGKIDDKDRFKIVDAQGNETFGYATNLNRAMVGGQVVITDIDSKTGKATGGHTTIYGGVVSIYDSNGTKLEGDVLKQRAGQLGVGIQPPSQTPGMGMANAPPPV